MEPNNCRHGKFNIRIDREIKPRMFSEPEVYEYRSLSCGLCNEKVGIFDAVIALSMRVAELEKD